MSRRGAVFDGDMQLELILKVLLLLTIANGAPVVAKALMGDFLSGPLDAGTLLGDGRPLLGASKTVRGIVLGTAATALCAPLVDVAWTTGLLIGSAAMAGDLFSSFVKRRIGLPPSSRASGLDQIPESLVPALTAMTRLGLTLTDVSLIVTIFTVGSIVLSRLLYKIKVRDRPY